MSKEILYILLPDFASHEMAYLMEAISSDEAQIKPSPIYVNKIVAPTMEPVTAIGSAALEFAKELLMLLENDTPERIEMYYQFNKQGFCELFQ